MLPLEHMVYETLGHRCALEVGKCRISTSLWRGVSESWSSEG
jgi:hypothetical protein